MLVMDEMRRLGETEPVGEPPEMETIGGAFTAMLKDLEPFPGSFLPKSVVERQRALAERSERDLTRMLCEIAIHLAVRDGFKTPDKILENAAGRIRFRDWQRVKREVRKVLGLDG